MLRTAFEHEPASAMSPQEHASREQGGRVSLHSGCADVVARISDALGVPSAVLQRRRGVWSLLGEMPGAPLPSPSTERMTEVRDAAGSMWTGLAVSSPVEWIVMVPGAKAEWAARPGLKQTLSAVTRELLTVRSRQRAEYVSHAAVQAATLTRRLAKSTDRQVLQQSIISALTQAVGAETGALALFCPADGHLRVTATHGYPQTIVEHVRIAPGEGIFGQMFLSNRPLLVGGGRTETRLPHRLRHRTQSCMVVPLRTSEQPIGVAAVADPLDGRYFDRLDMRVLRLLAAPAVLVLQREWLRQELKEISRISTRDPLTGLGNRRYLEVRFRSEMERSSRLSQPLAVMVADVDSFKRVNDTLGHLEGDRVLCRMATLLSDCVRISDVCTRYGGEEFVVLMPGADDATAGQIAERVRRTVELFFHDDRGGVPVTLSVGVAQLREGDTPDALLARADQALRAAKAAGKNVVTLAEGPARSV